MWHVYKTSSKIVARFAQEHGAPDVIQVRRTFNSKIEAVEWEHEVLRKIKAVKSTRWLNRTDGYRCVAPDVFSDAHKKKLSLAKIGYKQSPEHIAARSLGMKGMSRKGNAAGYKRTDEQKRRMSDAKKGKTFSDEHKEKLRQAKLKSWADKNYREMILNSRGVL